MRKYKIGSDPEVFFKERDSGEFIPAIGLIPGNKDFPCKIKEGFAVQIDNCAAEFNIPPSDNPEDMKRHIKFMLNYIKDNFLPKNLDIATVASAEFDPQRLDNPIAQTMGCSSSYNCWTESENERPTARGTNFRSSGFHLHCGYDNPTEKKTINIMRLMDLFIGLPSIIVDTDTQRRKLYGKAGEFRFCQYGGEYRVLSSYMLTDLDYNIDWIFESMDMIFSVIDKDQSKLDKVFENLGIRIQKAINHNLTEEVEQISEEANNILGIKPIVPLYVPQLIKQAQ